MPAGPSQVTGKRKASHPVKSCVSPRPGGKEVTPEARQNGSAGFSKARQNGTRCWKPVSGAPCPVPRRSFTVVLPFTLGPLQMPPHPLFTRPAFPSCAASPPPSGFFVYCLLHPEGPHPHSLCCAVPVRSEITYHLLQAVFPTAQRLSSVLPEDTVFTSWQRLPQFYHWLFVCLPY